MHLGAIGLAQTISVPPLLIARAAAAAIALSIGLSFVGVWLQFRSAPMAALARAWLIFGAYSSLVVVGLLSDAAMGFGAGFALVTLSLLTGPAFLDAALVLARRDAVRRWLWMATLVAIVVIEASGLADRAMAVATSACIIAAMVVVHRGPVFAGRGAVQVGFAMLLLRFTTSKGFAMVLSEELLQQPNWLVGFTTVFLACTIVAGYFMTVAVFAMEREAEVRERLALEREVARAQRTELLGQVAASVAHDFNNILVVTLASAQMVALPDATAEEREAATREIEDAAERGRDLTRRLIDFARPRAEHIVDFDPVRRVSELRSMLVRLAGAGIRVVLDVAPDLAQAPARVVGDPGQFDQMVLNLVANARDAMAQAGGTLTIRCERLACGSEAVPAIASGPCVRLSVADTGTGIPADVRDRIFDPWFSTKPSGAGTGLGLASTFAFVRQCGGRVTVDSVDGAGSTFWIYLPARPAVAQS